MTLLDIDNLVKFVMDALNGKAFIDDKQVVALSASKMYTCDTPRTIVRLERLPGRDGTNSSGVSLENVEDL